MSYWTNSAGVRFYYQDHGESRDNRPTVLLLSSWALDSTMWEHQVPALTTGGYRSVALDRRGHGRSDEPGCGYTLDGLADDVAEFVDHLDLGTHIVVGHSMGGCEAVRYVHRHPDRAVGGVALVSCPAPHLRAAVGDEAYEQGLSDMRGDRAMWAAGLIDGFYHRARFGVSDARAQETLATFLRVPIEVLVSCQRAGTATDVTADLEALHVPALVIHGDCDETVPIELTARPTIELLPDATSFLLYEGAGHGLTITHADQLNRDLLAFLSTISTSSASTSVPA